MSKVVFAGGNSRLKGMPERLVKEFEKLWKNNLNFYGGVNAKSFEQNKEKEIAKICPVKVSPDMLSFQGLWLVSQIAQPEQYITKKEYKEVGIEILKRKNLSKAGFV